MEYSYEELLAENAALKECVATQAKTIERFIKAYIVQEDAEESAEK